MIADGTQEAKTMVAGALFDFLGYITSRDGIIRCGSSESPTEALGAMMEWFKSRGLDPHNADVNGWTALLAAVSRPAEARGEAVAWAVVGRDAGLMHTAGMREEAEAFRLQLAPSWADGDSWRVVPILYPAPSGGEAK